MKGFPLRFACSVSLGLTLTACAAAQPIRPAPFGDPSAVASGPPTIRQTANPSTSNDAPPNAVDPGLGGARSVVTGATNSIVVRIRAAMTPPHPPARPCAYNALYALDVSTHELSWEFCFTSEKDSRTLEPREVATLDAALTRLKVVKSTGLCPVDAPSISVTTIGAMTQEYHDDLCGAASPVLDVDATDALLKVLYELTGN